MLSVRDLNSDNVPQKSWAGQHLAYTHGYGAIVAPANAKSPSGEPAFVAKDVPYDTDVPSLELDEPGVLYFGERLSSYVVVGSKVREIDYRGEEGTEFTEYDGEDGVKLDNVIKRAAFALRFGAPNLLISSQISSGSDILYIRDVRERAETLAPFLHFDADPYPVIVDGRIQWVLDAYTTTNRYPYGESANTEQLTSGSGLRHGFNYVRNSVKAVVDAYDGTVDFYVMPVDDPIIDAYRDAFPKLFEDFEDMPDGLKDHLRYPEDLFRVQTNMWGDYHIGDPAEFYAGDDRWDVARDPGTAGAAEATQTTDASGNAVSSRSARIDPYYLLTKLPGADAPEFILLRPVRAHRGARRQPAAHRLHGGQERRRRLRQAPGVRHARQSRGQRPRARAGRDPERPRGVRARRACSAAAGSSVSYGSLTAIPIDNGLVYVRPFYVTSTQTEVPALQKVIVYFGGEVAIRDTLQEGAGRHLRRRAAHAGGGRRRPTPNAPVAPPDRHGARTGVQAPRGGQRPLRPGRRRPRGQRDLAKYEQLIKQGRAKTAEAEKLLEDAGIGTTTTTTAGAQA